METVLRPDRKSPRVEAVDDDLLIFFKLCKSGYANSISDAKTLTAREVLEALNYEQFICDYEDTYMELNK